jgi:hypothetical protein
MLLTNMYKTDSNGLCIQEQICIMKKENTL